MRIRLVQKSVTLDDLELRLRTLLHYIICDFVVHHMNVNEDSLILYTAHAEI